MSKLKELIREMCPHGVEYKKLREIASVSRGGSFQKKDFTERGVPCIHYGQIYTRYGISADKTFTFISEECAEKQKKAVKNDIVMAVTSENIEDVCKCVAWLGDEEVAVSGHSAIIHHNQNAKFLVYYFCSRMFFVQKRKLAYGTKVIEVAPSRLLDIEIPVPPLPVQSEIVRILDNFTEFTANLAANLTAELTARKKQYAYYRDKLLNFESNIKFRQTDGNCISQLEKLIREICPNGVEYKTLGEIAVNMFRGSGIKRDQVTAEGIPCVRYGEIYTTYGIWFDQCVSHTQLNYVSSPKYFEHGDILFAVTGESVEDIAKSCAYMGNEKCLAGGDIVVLKHEQNPKYLSYALATTDAKMQKSKGKVKSKVVHASLPSLKQIKIPVPPFPVQCEIVRILDSFEEFTAEIVEKLSTEIPIRKKQYEYYRDKLLSFPQRKQ